MLKESKAKDEIPKTLTYILGWHARSSQSSCEAPYAPVPKREPLGTLEEVCRAQPRHSGALGQVASGTVRALGCGPPG